MTAEQLIRAAYLCGSIDQAKANELRSFCIEHDQRNRPDLDTRETFEARRKMLEAQSVRYTQERDIEMITRAQRELDWFRGCVTDLLSGALRT